MSGRLKFLLAVLAVGAGLTFWYTVGFSTGLDSPGTASIADQLMPTPAGCRDTDSDGLCDADETYWKCDYRNPDSDGDGFKDGEEVLSGHDPSVAGPDDFFNDKRNLTQRASALMLGAATSGNLEKTSENYQAAVDAIVLEIFTQYDSNVAVELDSIAISSSSDDALVRYGLRMSNLIQPMFEEVFANYQGLMETAKGVPLTDIPSMKEKHPEAFKAFTTAADAEAKAFGSRALAIKAVRTPPQMRDFHRSLLLYLRGMQQRYLTLKTIDRDPLTGLISLQVIRTLALQTPLELSISFQNSLANAFNAQ